MRTQPRRCYRCELWRVVARHRDGVETEEGLAKLSVREAWLREKLGRYPRPVGEVVHPQPT
jgi:hypothetical protein